MFILPNLIPDEYQEYVLIIAITFVIVLFLVTFGLAFVPASIAKKKGRSFAAFWWFGFGAFVPALIVAIVVKNRDVNTEAVEESPQELYNRMKEEKRS